MPNIWVCRTSSDYSPVLIREKFAGFRLYKYDPFKFRTEASLSATIMDEVTSEYPDMHFSGKTFGRQIWDISHNVQVGDWIYLDDPNFAEKPRDPSLLPGQKGKQRSFIVAAGIVTGPYRYKAKHEAYHQVPVDWKWRGNVLIDFGFQSQIFVNIDSRHPKVLADLKRIWTPESGGIKGGKGQLATPVPAAPAVTHVDKDWEEGEVVLKTHLSIERSQAAAKEAKEQARKRGGGLIKCACCGKAPADIYGVEIIDAHHVIPLKDTKGMARTPTPGDFEMLCPTCHRAVHHQLAQGRVEGREAIEAVRRTLFNRR